MPDRNPVDPDPAEMGRDHEALSALLEGTGLLCRQPEAAGCPACPRERVQECGTKMVAHVDQMRMLLLDHIHREEVLMAALPKSTRVNAHCMEHRSAHVAFSGKFNKVVIGLGSGDACAGILKLEALVADWIRDHVLRFDAELTSLAFELRESGRRQ